MRLVRYIVPLIAVLVLSSGISTAADSIPAKLTLREAISLALNANVNLKSSRVSQQTAVSRLRTANFNTTYGIGSSFNLEHTPDTDGVSSLVSTNITYKNLLGTQAAISLSPVGTGSNRGSVELQLTHPLLRGRGALSSMADTVQSARSNVSTGNNNLYQSKQGTVMSVIRAYYNAILAREEVGVQEKAVEFAQIAFDGARKREEAGLIAGIDVTRAETSLAQTKDTLQLQRQSAKGAIDQLLLAIGFGVGQTPELSDDIPEPDKLASIPSIEDAIKTALKNRSELDVFDTKIDDQRRRLAIAQDQLRPALNLVTSYNTANTTSGTISSTIFDSASFTTGLQLSFPMDTRTSESERDISERELKNLAEQRAYKGDQIAEEIRDAYRSLESTKTSITIYSQNLSAAETRLHIAQRMIEEGLGSNREELEAREALIQVQSSLLAAKKDYYLAGVNLRYAMGEDITGMGLK